MNLRSKVLIYRFSINGSLKPSSTFYSRAWSSVSESRDFFCKPCGLGRINSNSDGIIRAKTDDQVVIFPFPCMHPVKHVQDGRYCRPDHKNVRYSKAYSTRTGH